MDSEHEVPAVGELFGVPFKGKADMVGEFDVFDRRQLAIYTSLSGQQDVTTMTLERTSTKNFSVNQWCSCTYIRRPCNGLFLH